MEQRTIVDDKIVLGRAEKVYFPEIEQLSGVGIPAKIDTGADSTSIHATNIEITATDKVFEGLSGMALLNAIAEEFDTLNTYRMRDRKDKTDLMISFDITNPYTGESVRLTKPLYRLAMVKIRGEEGHIPRPVVKLELKIADKTILTDVNLADRERFSYPILIGKTFLSDTAWVDAGFDYLQEQKTAQVIGRKEIATVNGLAMEVSHSLQNRYSILHATDIKVDAKKQQVSFTTQGRTNEKKKMTLPLVKMLKFRDTSRPLVSLPIKIGEAESPTEQFNGHILAYLRDRSKNSSQLRLGREALNKNFVISLGETYLGEKPLDTLETLLKDDTSLMMSPKETINIDGTVVNAVPSGLIKTPVLNVPAINEHKTEHGRVVQYNVVDADGSAHSFEKPIQSKIRVGETVRTVVNVEVNLASSMLLKDVALEANPDAVEEGSLFEISPDLMHGALLVNTRSTNLLDKGQPTKAGYIENVELEGMRFPAKLDTGADVSSMHATDIETFDKDGKKWVSFTYKNAQGNEQAFTREVIDEMRIRARAGEEPQVRLVVSMRVKLGNIEKDVAVNLRDRSRFEYSMILGQNYLKNDIVVSSDQQFIYTGKAKSDKQ
ncbi:ATP-dependent zinc protease family protein [Photobacterium sanctipauli]|uniref:ATP-dependent zinc protease family protein n=1 Tax=Photobacterium sanctipauli TaxID=1342794 RepID=UPI001FE4961B|nr:RimK/LysX family protein [Photobacterium sanctipauli]